MNEIIRIPKENRWEYRELLLLADPEEQAVKRYLTDGEMYVLRIGRRDVSEAVVRMDEGGECELMNLATAEDVQGRGHARYLVRRLKELYSEKAESMLVGTSEDGRAFYERLGFKPAFVRKNFFVDHYSEPIIENGKQCIDMYCLRADLREKEQ